MTNIIRIALLFPLLLAATTWQYDTEYPGPMPSNAELRTVFAGGDWVVLNQVKGTWFVTKPVPCHPAVAATVKDCDTFIINDAATWNSTGFCAKRLPK